MTFPPELGSYDLLTERLLCLRTVLVTGPIAAEPATRVAAMLLTLDAESPEPVTVRLTSPGGDLGAALMLADTLDLMRAPVHLTCLGEAGGAALAVLAAAPVRKAAPGARFSLVEPRLGPDESGAGGGRGRTAGELAGLVAAHEAQLERLAWRIAQATHRAPADVRADLAPPGRVLDAAGALAYGLIDAVEGRA
jgi:ATP-dependent Clp protease protease subunit